MAQFSHLITLSPEEVQQAVLDLALRKGNSRGLSIDAHTFHTKAAIVIDPIKGAEISWRDE